MYEWKPQFCCKCQKLGHNCAKIPPKQHWTPKPPDEMQASTFPSTPVGMGPVGSQRGSTIQSSGKKDPYGSITGLQESSEDAWKEAPRSVTVRGKHHGFAASACNLACENGFDALGILNDLLELQKTRQ